MKKLFFTLVLSILLLLPYAKIVNAACGGDPSMPVICAHEPQLNITIYCDTQADCEALKEESGQGGQSNQNPNSYFCNDKHGITTPIGCIPFDSMNNFLTFLLSWAIGIGGGISFLLILFGGFQIMASSGTPEKIQAGKELITSAITGLLMLIFSIFILRFVGLDILGLGQFGFPAGR